MTCPCDTLVHPEPLVIAAGQSALPRQIAGFPDYRLAMLAELGSHPALADWRARATGDLGVMLLEMWALLCDMVSFYDQVHAQEAYLRTATLETSVRGLVEMLGYVPRPAVAAEVELFAFAEGNRAIVLPAHTAFRSGVFGSEPPQVFELVRDWMVHPWRNRFALARPRPTTATASSPDELLLLPGTTVRKGDVVLVVPSPASSTHNRARRAFAVTPIEGDDGERYVRLTLSSAISFATATELAQVEVLRAGRQASLWTLPIASGSDAINAAGTELVLDGLHRTLMTGERVVIERAGELRWFSIESVAEIQQKVKVGTDGEGTDLHGWIPATRIALDTDLNDSARTETSTTWSQSDAALLTIHHALSAEATVTAPFSTTVADDDPLVIAGDVREPEDLEPATRFALVDDDDRAALVSGSIDSSTHTLVRDGGDPGWTEPLSAPVMLLANAVRAIRGETIAREVLGSGDAATANQRFALTKAPLTYVASSSSDSPGGVASTLKVWVNDLQWQEVPSFYGQGPDDPIFVVRTDRDGVATVCFGDGENGARLPTGQANIVASYRFGAGAATPPPDSITQIAKPVRGLSSIAQPIAPAGGADAEPPDHVGALAPRSALVLGRAVSIPDMNALASQVPGVRAVQTTWGWQAVQQRPVVQCWYAGTPLEGAVIGRLRAMTEPTTPISAEPANPLLAYLVLQVRVDERASESEVLEQVFEVLGAEDNGLLRPEQLSVGQPLYRSQLSTDVLAVPGTVAIEFSAMVWLDRLGDLQWWLQDGYGATPGIGAYFDFENGGVIVNGKARSLG